MPPLASFTFALFGCLATVASAEASPSESRPPEWHLPESPPLGSAWDSAGTVNHRCVPIPSTMEMCYGIGYSEMRLPNMLNHESAKEVQDQAQHWMPLVKTACHREIRVLLCSIYAPVCIQRLPERSIKPCRSLCLAVQSSCLAIMLKFGFAWPDMLNCTQFPPEDDLMCIKRSVTLTGATSQSAECQACVREPSYESLVSGYCMNEIVVKARLEHASPSAPTVEAATHRRLQFKGRLRFFSGPRQLMQPTIEEEQQQLERRERRQNRGGRRRNKQLPGGARLDCAPDGGCPLLNEAAANPRKRYIVMGSVGPDGASIDVKFIAEWDNRRPAFQRALRSIRRDVRQRSRGSSGGDAGLCRGGVGLLGLKASNGQSSAGVIAASSSPATGRPRRNRRKGGGGGSGRGRGQRKKNRRRTEDPPPAA